MNTQRKPEVKATATVWLLVNRGSTGSSEGVIDAVRWTYNECVKAALSLGLASTFTPTSGFPDADPWELNDGISIDPMEVTNAFTNTDGNVEYDGYHLNTFDALYAYLYPLESELEGFQARAMVLRDDLRAFIEKHRESFTGDHESALRCARLNLDHVALSLSSVREELK